MEVVEPRTMQIIPMGYEPTSEVQKRKKQKPSREYVGVEEETQSDKEVWKVKKDATYARVVRKPSGDATSSKKTKTQGEPSRKPRRSKKQKFEIDEYLESTKVNIIPPKSLEEIKNEIVKDENMNNLSIYYDNVDDKDQREI